MPQHSSPGLVERNPAQIAALRVHDLGRDHAGVGRQGERRNNSHFVQAGKLTRQAKARLAEIGQDDVSELFSLRLTGTTRIYGIRDRRALKLLWYDPHHGTNARAVYPVQRR